MHLDAKDRIIKSFIGVRNQLPNELKDSVTVANNRISLLNGSILQGAVGIQVNKKHRNNNIQVPVRIHNNHFLIDQTKFTPAESIHSERGLPSKPANAITGFVANNIDKRASLTQNQLKLRNTVLNGTFNVKTAEINVTAPSQSPLNLRVEGNSLIVHNDKLTKYNFAELYAGSIKARGYTGNETNKAKMFVNDNHITLTNVDLTDGGNKNIKGAHLNTKIIDDKGIIKQTRNNSITLNSVKGLHNTTLVGGDYEATGNVLNFNNVYGEVNEVKNFRTVNVLFDFAKKESTVYAAAQQPLLSIKNSNLNKDSSMRIELKNVELMDADTQLISFGQKTEIGSTTVTDGYFDYEVDFSGGDSGESPSITINPNKKKGNEHSKTLATGFSAQSFLLSMGADLITNNRVKEGAFAYVGGGSNKFDANNVVVDIDGFNFVGGYAKSFDNLTLMAIGEYGSGNYESKIQGSNEGDLTYYGLGIAANYRMNQFNLDSSLRVGRTESDIKTQLTQDNLLKFTAKSNYMNANIGLGYEISVGMFNVEPFARYQYTKIFDDSYTDVTLNDFVSSKTTLGVNVAGTLAQEWNWKTGIAWEHEFDGDVSASKSNQKLETLDMSGDSAVLDLSVSYKPASLSQFAVDFGIKGRVGDYSGVQGYTTVQYQF